MSIKTLLLASVTTLLLVSCKKDREETIKEKQFDLTGFTNIYSSEKINLTIKHAGTFSIKAKGAAHNIDKLDMKLTDNDETLDISYKDGANSELLDVEVGLPWLDAAFLTGETKATIGGFSEQPGLLGLVISGKANVTTLDGATIISVQMTGNTSLTLNGNTASLAAIVSGNGVVHAYDLAATRAYMTTSQEAKVYVKPSLILYGSASDNSRIYYKGDPQNTEFETNGNGQIIKE